MHLMNKYKAIDLSFLNWVYDEILATFEPTKSRTINKSRFLSENLKLIAEHLGEDASVTTKVSAVRFKYRSQTKTLWVFDVPDINDRFTFIKYLFDFFPSF